MNEWGNRHLASLQSEKQVLNRSLNTAEIVAVTQRITEIIVKEERAKWEAEHPKKKKQSEMSDEEWVKSLEGEPALAGINIKQEIGRAQFWCKQNKRQPTRRFLVNWLNKAERVVDLKAMGAQHATGLKLPPPQGPANWLTWLQTEISILPEDHPAHGQLLAALNNRSFSMLPNSWQIRCREQSA